jgi:hypothetical protein
MVFMSFVYICCVSLFVDHVYFLWLKLQSKTLIQSQMVESSVHSCVVWINQTPDIHIKPGIRLNQLKVFHIFYLYLFGITSSFLSPVLQSIGPWLIPTMLKLAGCIKLYPLAHALSLSFKFHVEQEEYYPTRCELYQVYVCS